jgi:S-adenosylmethionine synthetase
MESLIYFLLFAGLMSLEAAAGKNPVTHVGKLYNVLAARISNAMVTTVPEITAAQCLMVSRIGRPVTEPAIVQMAVATRDGFPLSGLKNRIDEIANHHMGSIPGLIDDFVEGEIDVF